MTLGKKIVLMLMAIIATSIAAAVIYFTSALHYSTSEFKKTFKEIDTGVKSTAIEHTEPFSILLMGVDTGSGDRMDPWAGNSDSMIVVTVNPKTKRTTMTSLERDILTTLTGPKESGMNGVEAKLNAAYASGEAQMAIMTVENLLDIKIDNYMQINMQGLVDLVNAVGGIKVTNPFDFDISIEEQEPQYTATVAPGTHKVNGDQALVFSRMRYQDPEGDYGRQRRQREVISLIVKKLLAFDSIGSYKKVLKAVSNNMQTDISVTEKTIPHLLGYRDSLETLENYQLHGEDATLEDGGSYQIVTTAHLLETQNRIKAELGLPTLSTLEKTNAVLYETLYGYSPETDYPDENAPQTHSTINGFESSSSESTVASDETWE
ncbi:glycopolymer--peptidoglycan transferase LytR [Streptococcus sp. S784/96/1]|uniref:glycopolymer--peptidoglycan transferase LytR n=1 Tax=Streptococcus sp. S784/96/1 TaxID=2653499 RepID=UPI001389C9B7|nr:LCP family protein [Streptococcus sp. S784/96/1]